MDYDKEVEFWSKVIEGNSIAIARHIVESGQASIRLIPISEEREGEELHGIEIESSSYRL